MKEAQVIIEEEEQILDNVLTSLQAQQKEATTRMLRQTDEANDLTKSYRSERRDTEKQQMSSDVTVSRKLAMLKTDETKVLEKLLEKPYFARIVLEEEQPNGPSKQLEYKIGNATNLDCRIIDWRKAPISKLYYEYQEGDEYSEIIQSKERNGIILLRNKVEIENGQLKHISCRHGNFIHDNGEWKAADGAAASARGGYDQLPDILSLITPDQFRTITEEADTAVLLQGIAGSGKTTVALHRLSWLAHQEEAGLTPDNCVVIVRGKVLQRYVETTLRALGVDDIRVRTFRQWTRDQLKKVAPQYREQKGGGVFIKTPIQVKRLLRSLAMLKAVEEYVNVQREAALTELQPLLLDEHLSPQERKIIAQLQRQNSRFVSHLRFLEQSVRATLHKLGPNSERFKVRSELQHVLQKLIRQSEGYLEDLLAILGNPSVILEHDEHSLLDREVIEQSRQHLLELIEGGGSDSVYDAPLLCLYLAKNDSLLDRNGDPLKYRHVLVDEIQDFSAIELASIIGSVEHVSQLTLVGDTGQATRAEKAFPGWDALREHWNMGESLSRFISLEVSHRNPLPIMKLADFVRGEKRTNKGKPGKPPLWFKCSTEDDGVREAIAWIERVNEKYAGSLVSVICANNNEARYVSGLLEPTFGAAVRYGDDDAFSFEDGIVVTDVRQVKGLEFPHVLLWNPSSKNYPNKQRARNALYVAITRAEQHLCMVTWDPPSPLLPQLHSNLVRGFEK